MKSRRSPVTLIVAACLALAAATAFAQSPLPVLAPSNVVLPNYTAQAPGLTSGLEGGAAVARGEDALSTYYNPAGLSRVKQSSLIASGGAMQWVHVTPNAAFPTNVGSVGMLPVQLGFLWREPFDYANWSMAVSFSTENNWDHALSAEGSVGTPTVPERYAYSAASAFVKRTASVGAGYSPDEKLRIGGSADFVLTQLHSGPVGQRSDDRRERRPEHAGDVVQPHAVHAPPADRGRAVRRGRAREDRRHGPHAGHHGRQQQHGGLRRDEERGRRSRSTCPTTTSTPR